MQPDGTRRTSWKPTKKWIAALASGLIAIAANFVDSGLVWDNTETGMLITLLVGLATAYVKSNDPTPGGVPLA